MRTSVLFDDELAAQARELGINVSEAAREGEDAGWDQAESWGEA